MIALLSAPSFIATKLFRDGHMKVYMKRTGSALNKRTGSKDSPTDNDAAIIVIVYNSCILYTMYIDIINLLSHFLF
jgi:hypothetical protein